MTFRSTPQSTNAPAAPPPVPPAPATTAAATATASTTDTLQQRLAAAGQWLRRQEADTQAGQPAGSDSAQWSNWRNWINS